MDLVLSRRDRPTHAQDLYGFQDRIRCLIQGRSDVRSQILGDPSLKLTFIHDAVKGIKPVPDASHFFLCHQTLTVSNLVDLLTIKPGRIFGLIIIGCAYQLLGKPSLFFRRQLLQVFSQLSQPPFRSCVSFL